MSIIQVKASKRLEVNLRAGLDGGRSGEIKIGYYIRGNQVEVFAFCCF